MTATRLGKGKKKSRPPASIVTVPSQELHQRETTGSDSSHVPTHKTQEREKLPLDFCHFGHSVASPVLGQQKPRRSAPNYPLDRYQLPCIKLSLSAIPASSSI